MKLGGASAFIGKVGDIEFGRMLVDILKKNDVNSEGVCFDKEERTTLVFVTLKSNGERKFMFYRNPSADILLKEAEMNTAITKGAKIFHYDSISLISEPCRLTHMENVPEKLVYRDALFYGVLDYVTEAKWGQFDGNPLCLVRLMTGRVTGDDTTIRAAPDGGCCVVHGSMVHVYDCSMPQMES